MSLEHQASTFAEELTTTIHAVSPGCEPFTARIVEGLPRVSVRQNPGSGIHLRVDGEPLLLLKATFECCLDGEQEYMAIEKSKVEVLATNSSQPIFRYEYDRNSAQAPAAHMHVHAHRDAFTFLMARSGAGTPRARRRLASDRAPSIQDVHFPLGGHRFRPCLEDILHMLIDEFGIDSHAGTFAALQEGRIAWRRRQARSVVRDDPQSAVSALKALGYDVTWLHDSPEPPVRWDRLRER